MAKLNNFNKGHPKRQARRLRAYARGGCQPGCTKHKGCGNDKSAGQADK